MRGPKNSSLAAALATLGALAVAPPLAAGVVHAQDATSSGPAAAVATYRELLAPYGMWVSLAPYGEVWVPREAARPDFVPYASGGRWVDGPRGLIFESTLPWGAVCFHHGRWTRPSELGAWAWVPGTTWAPSWVEWRTSGDRAAWRAMGPAEDRAARPWILARTAELGAPDLAARARVVDAEAVARFSSDLPHLPVASVTDGPVEVAGPEPEPVVTETVPALPAPAATAGPGQVVLSGGGRIVVHERGRDRVIEVPPTIVARDSAEARLAEERRRLALERQGEREREAAQRTHAIIARAETRDREAREERTRPEPAPAATSAPATTVVTQRWLGGYGFGGYGFGGYGYGAYAPSAYGSVGFPATPRRPTDAVTPGAASPRFDARLPFGTWRD